MPSEDSEDDENTADSGDDGDVAESIGGSIDNENFRSEVSERLGDAED